MIRIQQIHLTLEEDMTLLPEKIIKKLRIAPEELLSWRIHKETFDARWRHMQFTYTLDCTLKHEENVLKHPHKDITKTPDECRKKVLSDLSIARLLLALDQPVCSQLCY